MLIRTRLVFYGADCLPYKDFERKVHYPIIDPSFQGASQTDQIKFYVDQIGGSNITWVAVAKLPNGKIITKLLETNSDENGTYALLEMSNQFTQVMGNVFISLKGYAGGSEIVYDDESEIYVAQGNPIIQATGSVQINIRYATPIDETEEDYTYQELLALISGKLDKNSAKYLKVVSTISDINSEDYEQYIASGSIVYAKDTNFFYLVSGSYPTFTYTQLSFDYVQLKNVTSSTTVSDLCGTNAYTLCFIEYNHGIYYFEGIYTGGGYVCIVQRLGGVLKRSGSGVSGSTTFANILTTLEQNDNIDMSTTQNIKGQKTITSGGRIIVDSSGSFNLYNSKITTNAKGYFARVGVTTGQYVDYKLPFGYSDVGAQEYTLATYEQVQEYAYPKTQVYTKSEIDTKLTSMLVYKGTKTVAELNALVSGLGTQQTGYFYNISDSGVLTWTEGGTTYTLDVLQGDNICWTGSGWDKLTMDLSAYDDKFIAAGFFEVQDYNDNTGEITMVYSSDLYDMSYDGTSGVLTIEAN